MSTSSTAYSTSNRRGWSPCLLSKDKSGLVPPLPRTLSPVSCRTSCTYGDKIRAGLTKNHLLVIGVVYRILLSRIISCVVFSKSCTTIFAYSLSKKGNPFKIRTRTPSDALLHSWWRIFESSSSSPRSIHWPPQVFPIGSRKGDRTLSQPHSLSSLQQRRGLVQ